MVNYKKDGNGFHKKPIVHFFPCTLFLIVFLMSFLINPAKDQVTHGNPDWLNDWGSRIRLFIDHEKIDSNLTNYPLMVYLSDSAGISEEDLSYIFDEVGASSKKIAITTDDGLTQCYVEIERWNAGNNEAWLWVRVPSISASEDTSLYFYYDSEQPDNNTYVGDPGSNPAKNVWSNGFLGVWHKNNGGATLIADSTSNDNHGFKSAENEPQQTNGRIAWGQLYDGIDDYVAFGNDNLNQKLNNAPGITFSAWINPSSLRNGGVDDINVITDIPIHDDFSGIMLYLFENGKVKFGGRSDETDGFQSVESLNSIISSGNWFYLTGSLDYVNDRINVFLNGNLIIQGNSTFNSNSYNPGNGGNELLGSEKDFSATGFFHGVIDEARIATVSRSASWITADYYAGIDDLITFHKGILVTGKAEVAVTPLVYHSQAMKLSARVTVKNTTENPETFKCEITVLNDPTGENPEKNGYEEHTTGEIAVGQSESFNLVITLSEALKVSHKINGFATIKTD